MGRLRYWSMLARLEYCERDWLPHTARLMTDFGLKDGEIEPAGASHHPSAIYIRLVIPEVEGEASLLR